MDVSVKGDGAEVEDGRRRAHDVEGDPRVAELSAERPVAEQVVDAGERHHQGGDERVGDGQRGEEQVADLPQPPVREDGGAHQRIARDR